MSSPIKYQELADIDGLEQAIVKLTLAAKELDAAFTKSLSSISKVIDVTKGEVSDLGNKVEATDTKLNGFTQMFKNVNTQVDDHAVKLSTLKKGYRDFEETLTITENSVIGLTSKAKALKAQYESLDPAVEGNKDKMAQLSKEYQDTIKNVNSLEKELKGTASALKSAERSYSSMSTKLNDLKKKLKDIPGAFDEMTGAINETDPEIKAIIADIQKYDAALKKADEQMGSFTRNVGNYEGATVSLKQELRKITNLMAEMKAKGEDDSEEFKQMAKRAGEMKLAIGDAADEIKYFGAERQNLQGMIGTLEGVAGAAAIAEGGMALFGAENKNVAETIKRLQSIQTIMIGVNQIGTLLEKESAAMIMISNAQRKVSILVKKLDTAAESQNIIVRKLATAAQWALNNAMKANPAGILIGVIIALAGAVYFFTRNTKNATEAQLNANKAQEEYLNYIKELYELRTKGLNDSTKEAERDLELAKSRGASEAELLNLEQQILEVRLKKSQYGIDWLDKENKSIGTLNKSYDESLTTLKNLKTAQLNNNSVKFIDGARVPTDKDIENASTYSKNLKTRIDLADQIWEEHENNLTAIQAFNLKKQQKAKELANRDEIGLINARLSSVKEGSKKELDTKIELISKQKVIDLKNANLTKGEIKAIEAQAAKEIADLKKEYNQQINTAELNTSISAINIRLLSVKSGTDEELNIRKELIDEQLKLNILGAQNSIVNEAEKNAKIKELNAQALKDKKELEKAKAKAELEAKHEQDLNDRDLKKVQAEIVLNDENASKGDKKTAKNFLNPENNLKYYDDEIKFYTDHKDLMFQNETEYQQKITELTLQKEQERLDIIKQKSEQQAQIRQAFIDTFTMGVNALGEIEKNQSEAKIQQLESEKERAIAAAGDNASAKEAIEKNYTRRINQEKAKQAKVDRDLALFNIAISTAMAVAKIWAEVPKFDFGASTIVLTGLALAQGAMQAAVVMSKPLPKFKTGTQNAPEGLAVINDGYGPELIERRGHLFMPSGKNRLVNLQRGDKVHNAYDTQRIIENAQRNGEMERIIFEQNLNGKLSSNLNNGRIAESQQAMYTAMMHMKVNEKAIGDAVGQKIAELPIEQHNWDDRGYRRSIRSKNTIVNLLNERNTL